MSCTNRTKQNGRSEYRAIRFLSLAALAWLAALALPEICATKIRAVEAADLKPADEDDPEAAAEEKFPGGAPLKTDPELEHLLKRAELFAAEGTYQHAATLWQKVLNESGDTLVTRDGRTYVTLAQQIEQTIAKLPPEGLRIYRISADGEAQAILAAGKDREEEALAEVVRKYFVSSFGDDAAYKLGCYALDRGDFVGAGRLFAKVIEEHPDPSVSLADAWLRLAVAAAHVGDADSAAKALEQVSNAAGRKPSVDLIALVREDSMQAGRKQVASGAASGDWSMVWGDAARRGHMPALPTSVISSPLTKMWDYHFPLNFNATGGATTGNVYAVRSASGGPADRAAKSEPDLIKRWTSGSWRPSGQLLFAAGRVYFKTDNDLTCWDANSPSEQPLWRTAWLNEFQLDAATQMLAVMYQNMGQQNANGGQPTTPLEILLFGDRIHHSMSISQGLIFNLEGRRVPRHGGAANANAGQPRQQGFQWGIMPRRTRGNWLAAYDTRNGKAKWYRSAAEDAKLESNDIGFMAAPVPYGNLLLIPVTDGGAISLYALAREDGATIWKTYLCDEPVGGCDVWSPVGVSVEGRDAYVVCGTGVVFALDAVSGTIRYAVRYQRDGKQNQMMRNFGYAGQGLLTLEGWNDDLAIPYGRTLVVFATDHNRLVALDRRTGQMLWDSPRTPFDHPANYCLGVNGGGLFVGGKNVVRRYDIVSGRLIWETVIPDSFGRGVLTDDAVYVPAKESILKLGVEKGENLGQQGVSLTSDESSDEPVGKVPVGNLFSDGQRLWGLGANRLYVLTSKQQRLEVLDAQIRAGNPAAYLERMKLYAIDNKVDEATADLLGAFDLLHKQQGIDEATVALIAGARSIELIEKRPRVMLQILADKFVDAPTGDPAVSEEPAKQLVATIVAALRTIEKEKTVGAAAEVLKTVTLLRDEYQLSIARQALAATATKDDLELVRGVVAGENIPQQSIVCLTLTNLLQDEAKPLLKSLLSAQDDGVRYTAARSLGNLGDRQALPAFVKLLESSDPRIRSRSVQTLRGLTGQKIAFGAYDNDAARARGRKEWQEWLAKEGDTAKLTFPVPDAEPLLGRTLIAYYGQSLVVELDAEGKERWQQNVPNVWAAQGLPDGHRLVASYAERSIIEFDENGKQVWKKEALPGNPFSVERLAGGNTLVACSNSQKVIEYKPDGNVAWEATVMNGPRDATRLENGNTLVALSNSNNVVEIDGGGKVVWEATGLPGAVSVQRLENGNTLVALMNGGRVVELNQDGKEVWSRDGFNQPFDAQRLANGNTLIADSQRVIEVDAGGKEVWRRDAPNASSVSRF